MVLRMIDLRTALGLGVAGNFTGHLEQAGEASDFAHITAAPGAPKGVFPFYIPTRPQAGASDEAGPSLERQSSLVASPVSGAASESFLRTFPLSADTIQHPGQTTGQPANLQIEPELALLCELRYDDSTQRVEQVLPTHFTAYNDCSLRNPRATKISQKKNWGSNTKGLACGQWIALDSFTPQGMLSRFRLACYLLRDGKLHAYGEDSPASGYSTMYQPLLDWLVDRLNHQQDQGPLENMAEWLRDAGHPSHAVVSIGATRYTAFGETTYLQVGDESVVIAYDETQHDAKALEAALFPQETAGEASGVIPAGILRGIPGAGQTCSVLRQRVVG